MEKVYGAIIAPYNWYGRCAYREKAEVLEDVGDNPKHLYHLALTHARSRSDYEDSAMLFVLFRYDKLSVEDFNNNNHTFAFTDEDKTIILDCIIDVRKY